jgi:hypothetical protein
VRENNCQFILHIDVREIVDAGTSEMGMPRPRSVEIGNPRDDPRADGSGDNRATARYRIMRAGELEESASDVVTAHDRSPDMMLVSQLMDQIASRVASELRKPR